MLHSLAQGWTAVAQIVSLQLAPSPPDQDGSVQAIQMTQVGAKPWSVPMDFPGEGCTSQTPNMDEADQWSGPGMGLSSPISIEFNFGLGSLSAEKGWQTNALN